MNRGIDSEALPLIVTQSECDTQGWLDDDVAQMRPRTPAGASRSFVPQTAALAKFESPRLRYSRCSVRRPVQSLFQELRKGSHVRPSTPPGWHNKRLDLTNANRFDARPGAEAIDRARSSAAVRCAAHSRSYENPSAPPHWDRRAYLKAWPRSGFSTNSAPSLTRPPLSPPLLDITARPPTKGGAAPASATTQSPSDSTAVATHFTLRLATSLRAHPPCTSVSADRKQSPLNLSQLSAAPNGPACDCNSATASALPEPALAVHGGPATTPATPTPHESVALEPSPPSG